MYVTLECEIPTIREQAWNLQKKAYSFDLVILPLEMYPTSVIASMHIFIQKAFSKALFVKIKKYTKYFK